MSSSSKKYTGIALAVLATMIWSGNFIVARGVYKEIPPISLAFYRWGLASILLLPFTYTWFKKDWPVIRRSGWYFFFAALTGISLFNTFVYIGGQYTTAINLALVGTTSSPIFSVILARVFLREKIGWQKIVGLVFCVCGILFLLSKGDPRNLLAFRFTRGDGWVLLAALAFSIYNTLVKRKPAQVSRQSFLLTAFSLGTLLLLPFYIWETTTSVPVAWNLHLVLIIVYLALGASVIAFLIWNMAITHMGAGRTALFGNLIPVFSSMEAVWILGESITWIHFLSFALVIAGLIIANYKPVSDQ